jgi:predicted phosphodiesterase
LRRVLATLLFVAAFWPFGLLAQIPPLPVRLDSLKFAVIGDNGTGDQPQYELAAQMVNARQRFPYDLVIMLGDNIYGKQDFDKKFERPYASLLKAGVTFRASLGNHDSADSRYYKPFNMNGERYYTYALGDVRFFVLDTNVLDAKQLEWIDVALTESNDEWKIAYFHHPLYCDAGRHGSAVDIRVLLEPIFVRHGINVVFSGHDHIYERLKPQKGIYYFVAGSGGQLRKGDLQPSAMTAAGFDQDQSFMLVEVAQAEMFFQVISRTGTIVDQGVIRRPSQRETTVGDPHDHITIDRAR